MKPRELIPYLLAAQALTLVLQLIIVFVLLSWKRQLVAAIERANGKANHPTMPLRKP